MDKIESKPSGRIKLSSLEDFEGRICIIEERDDGSAYLLGYFEKQPQVIGFRMAEEPKPDKDAEFDKKCRECEYDPQAAEFSWFLKHGWIPPAEAKNKDAECQERIGGIFREIEDTFKLGGYDPDRLKALKKQEGVK